MSNDDPLIALDLMNELRAHLEEAGEVVQNDMWLSSVFVLLAGRIGTMDMIHYEMAALRTAGPVKDKDARMFIALALAGEAGELANYVKKGEFHGHELNDLVIIDELGDMLWYIARAASLLGTSLEEIAEHNIEKLKVRYPDKFSVEASVNRVV